MVHPVRLRLPLLAVLTGVALTGCTASSDLLGAWTITDDGGGQGTVALFDLFIVRQPAPS